MLTSYYLTTNKFRVLTRHPETLSLTLSLKAFLKSGSLGFLSMSPRIPLVWCSAINTVFFAFRVTQGQKIGFTVHGQRDPSLVL